MRPTSPSTIRAHLAALATIILWAGAFPAIAIGVKHAGPIELAAVRFAAAAAIMGAWLILRGERMQSMADLGRVACCGLMGIALYNVLLNTGQQTVSPGAASFIIATQPVFAALVCYLLKQENFSRAAVIGTLLSLLGVGIISIGQQVPLHIGGGAPLVLAAAACSGAYFVLQRPLVLRYGAVTSASWTILAGALLLAPWLPRGLEQVAQSSEAIAATAFLALGAGLLGYICWMTALAGLGAARAANLLFLMAPLAMIFSIPITGDWPGPAMILGGTAALAGVAMVNRSFRAAPAVEG